MSTIEEFEAAPVGATATRYGVGRAMRTIDQCTPWATTEDTYLDHIDMESRGYALDPAAPATAREALDLAWELAYLVKEGQMIPKGAQYLHRTLKTFVTRTLSDTYMADSWDEANIRTLDPLPEPEPDWLDAPAVMATCTGCDEEEPGFTVHTRTPLGLWRCVECGRWEQWTNLRDVTPLYPKEQDR